MAGLLDRYNCVLLILGTLLVAICLADICPDHKKSCRKGQTCCDDKQGGYGCCPYENATCCTDGLHCCPQGTSCDLTAGRCRKNKFVKLVPGLENISEVGGNDLDSGLAIAGFFFSPSSKQTCPDQKQTCPTTYTCCSDPHGGFACCPFTNGTCCSDRIHCCPNGRTCGSGRCE